jgi:hypothetical protein
MAVLVGGLLAGAVLGAEPLSAPRMFFGGEDLPMLRERAQTPLGRFVLARIDELVADADRNGFSYGNGGPPYQEGFYAAGAGLLWVIHEDRRFLEMAARFAEKARTQRRGEFGDWGNMQRIAGLALAYDFCRNSWDADFTQRVREQLVRDAEPRAVIRPDGMREAGFTAAAGLAALAVLDTDREAVSPHLKVCAERTGTLFERLGKLGWRNDFAGYEAAMELLMPFAQAYRRVVSEDVPGADCLSNVPLLALMTDAQFYLNSDRGGYPARFAICHHYVGMGLAVADPAVRPALKWLLDQHVRPGAEDYVGNPFDAVFVFVNYQEMLAASVPAEVLPRSLYDGVGGVVLRSGFRAGDVTTMVNLHGGMDIPVIGTGAFLINQTIATTDGHAGVLRWTGAGPQRYGFQTPAVYDWDGEPNVIRIEGTLPRRGARLTNSEFRPDGSGTVCLVVDRWVAGGCWGESDDKSYAGMFSFGHHVAREEDLGITWQRTIGVDYSGRCGARALIVVADRVAGHGERAVTEQITVRAAQHTLPPHRVKYSEQWRGDEGLLPGERKSLGWPWAAGEAEAILRERIANGLRGVGRRFEALPGRTLGVTLKPEQGGLPVAMQITFLAPQEVKLSYDRAGGASYVRGDTLFATGGSEFIFVITVQDQNESPPAVKWESEAPTGRIRIGHHSATIDGDRVHFGQ